MGEKSAIIQRETVPKEDRLGRDEIKRLLAKNIGKSVRLVYMSGDVDYVVVVNLDGEGFVGDVDENGLVSPYWIRLEDIASVLPSTEDRTPDAQHGGQ